MRLGYRQCGAATCTVSESAIVKRNLRSHLREITDLYVAPEDRRKGWARALLDILTLEADEAGLVLVLQVRDNGEVPADVLEAFYRTFGFERIQESPVLMARAPQVLSVAPEAKRIEVVH